MRLLIIIALVAGFTCHLRSDEESSKFLSDSQLMALGEPRLDHAKPNNSVVRIMVIPSSKAPIMIKWLINVPGAQSEAVVRRPKMEVSKDGSVVYRGFDVDCRVSLSKGQTLALHEAMSHAKLGHAPSDDWKPPALDGSGWIVEYRDTKSYRLLKRSNLPDDPDFLSLDSISKKRLLNEANLSQFCMLLWNLAGVNDLLYFQNKNAQHGGAVQPATRSETDSEGGDKPQPEAERRSR